ncbi:MAG TPA: TauD/TfdA family dioxygenase [Sphingobium sp.]
MTTQIKIEPINERIGAYVTVDPTRLLDEGVPEQILDALNTYNVLVFPEAHMTDDQFVGLSDYFGENHSLAATADASEASAKGMYRIEKKDKDANQLDYIRGNDIWHMDGTSYNLPGKSTMLKCERPADEGGETDFASLYAAYEAMSDEKKAEIESLRVEHCFEAIGRQLYDEPTQEQLDRWQAFFPPTEHPLVWHQQGGRTSLLIGGTAFDIVGKPHEEGLQYLNDLLDYCTQPQFTYRHSWKEGDMVMFNNPGLLHRSLPYKDTSGRVLHRTTIKGMEEIQKEQISA